ncbi:hypothetical protein ABEB36_008131 [Hypothenemus hampei]|uniref:Fanconi anemia group D2 protein n=1 Tax=Hypothenemus hampei TaxID=57062 RepID=A0ABD1ELA5_HYPHA
MSSSSFNVSASFSFSQKSQSSQVVPGDFRKILAQVGITLISSTDQSHILNKEQALVIRELIKYFNENQESKVQFQTGLRNVCSKEKHFRKLLMPTRFEKGSEIDAIIYQDSLFSLFLKVPQLQDDVIEILLENVTTVCMDLAADTSWFRMLLKPLRCLPTIKNDEVLTRKLIDVLDIATLTGQLEILEAIPEIIPDNQCNFTAKELIRLLDHNEELCGPIVDCLSALNLNNDIRVEINERILTKLTTGVSMKVYLLLLKFLLSDFKLQSSQIGTLLQIRNSLDSIVGNGKSDKQSDKTLIFSYLQTSAVTQKALAEGWLNTISSCKNSSDHKPVDILIIFMLHHTSEIRKRILQALFRKRVSLGLLKPILLDKSFEKYFTQQLLKDYVSDIIEIGCYMLKFPKDRNVIKFATHLFQIIFSHPHMPGIYRTEMLANLISMSGSNDPLTIITVLKLIHTLASIDSAKLQTHTSLLMQLLEKLETFDFQGVKIVFDILCLLLCGERANDSLSGFKDQIFNTIRKQLSCSERIFKQRGIISALMMVKHTASVDSNESENDISTENSATIADLPTGPAKDAAELLELVICAIGENPELLCLYYDQLASILASNQLFNKYFLYWLYKKVEEDFEIIFLTDSVPQISDNLDFSIQYILNKPEETDKQFAINIAGYISAKNDKILFLAPYFRVLRLLHFRQHGHLSEIDSLLGCGVVLPDIMHPNETDPELLSNVVDCLFHCVNWFREIINAFVIQKSQLLQERVVNRLKHLIEVENKFKLFYKQVPGHNLPSSYFDSVKQVHKQMVVAKPACNPRKKMAKSVSIIVNETCNTTINTQDITTNKNTKKSATTSVAINVDFREMDTDIIRLIKYPLEDESSVINLNIPQINFISNDFIFKLTTLTQRKCLSSSSHLNDVNPDHLIKDCEKIVGNLIVHLDVFVKKLNNIVIEPLETQYTEEVNEVKTCFGNILQIFCLIFQWPGFLHASNMDLLKNILKAARTNSNTQSITSVNKLIMEFVTNISLYSRNCLHLSHAVSLISVVQVLYSLTTSCDENKNNLNQLSKEFLSRKWYDYMGKLDQGHASNQNMEKIVTAFLKNMETDSLANLIEKLIEEISAFTAAKDACLSQFPAINKKNFHVFYLGLCNALLEGLKSEINSLTNIGHLSLWLTIAIALTNLMVIAKSLNNRNNLSSFLKKTIAILKIFLTQGIPMMEILMKKHTTEVCNVFKTIQTTTRFLHHLCCQSKMTQDSSIVAHIPSFKQTLESIVYRVKAALVANNCSSAFWLGNLRNRNIDGEDILSQTTETSSVVNDDHEESDRDILPSDDENLDVYNDEEHSNDSIQSQVYN